MGPTDPLERNTEKLEDLKDLEASLRHAVESSLGTTATLKRVSPLAGDASSRRYFRLALAGGRRVPPTIVAMVLGHDRLPLSSDELAIFERPPAELPFVNVHRFLTRIGVRIPALHYYDPEAGILLLEDIGSETLRAAVTGAGEARVLDLFRAAIDILVRLQVVGTRNADDQCVAFRQRFDRRLLGWEFEHFLENGVPHATADERQQLRQASDPLLDRLADAPMLLAHRDYHAWNLHVYEGALCVIDFQDALLAPATYDLASLLTDRDIPTIITPPREETLIAYFVEACRRMGVACELCDVRAEYFLCALHRVLKVIGRFHYLANVKGKHNYMQYMPCVVSKARRLLDSAANIEPLRRALQPHLARTCAQ